MKLEAPLLPIPHLPQILTQMHLYGAHKAWSYMLCLSAFQPWPDESAVHAPGSQSRFPCRKCHKKSRAGTMPCANDTQCTKSLHTRQGPGPGNPGGLPACLSEPVRTRHSQQADLCLPTYASTSWTTWNPRLCRVLQISRKGGFRWR